ncbi:S1 family peptidase [Longimicrobium sp.]|uniref:S1 family peptidase n=1 Tax=Longimicrobium sp. TaxID=2029185 RepID=UPI003B3AA343
MHQRFRTPALLVATMAFTAACDRLPSDAAVPAPDGEARSEAVVDGIQQDAAVYAATFGVSAQEGARRLQLQEAVDALNARLTAEQAATFAGLSIEHAPEFHVVARFTRKGEETIRPYLTPELAQVVRVEPARFTLQQLERRLEASYHRVRNSGIPAAGGVDVRANRAEVHVQRGRSAAARAVLAAGEAAVVEVDHLPKEEIAMYGGLGISTCTTGFTVYNSSGSRGVSTAGHCGNSQSLSGYALTFRGEAYSGSYDIQWHNASGHTYPNTIKVSTSTRAITGTRSRTSQTVGSQVCKQGKTTGYTCGTIATISYCASGACTWVQVAGNGVNLSEGGDSGGPWFSGNTAYGSHTYGMGNDSAYMPINYISGISVTVATS